MTELKKYDPGASRAKWFIVGILALAVLVRLLHFWAISETAWPSRYLTASQCDDYAFYQWAKQILAGDLLGRDTYHPYFDWMRNVAPLETWYKWWGGKELFHQAPLYPYLLAGLLWLSGGSVPLVLLAQLLIGALQALVMYHLGTFLFDRRAGLVAATITALYGPFIFHQAILLRDWLVPVVDSLTVLALLHARNRDRWWLWSLAGASLGLALLAKETAMLFIVLAVVWIILSYRKAWRHGATAAVLVIVGLLLCLAPLFLRNYLVGAPVLALSNRAGEVFAQSHTTEKPSWKQMAVVLERSQGRATSAVERTLSIYRGRWFEFARLEFDKMRMAKDPYEFPNNTSFYYGVEISPILRWLFGYAFVFPLGLAGMLLSLKSWRKHALIYFYGASTVAGLMATYAMSRYRLALVPFLILYSAAILVRLAAVAREKNLTQALGIIGVICVLAFFQRAFVPLPEIIKGVYPVDYAASAEAYARDKRFDLAVGEMDRLVSRPKERISKDVLIEGFVFEGDYRTQWATQLLREGKREEAKKQVELAETAYRRSPDRSIPYYNLGLLYAVLGEPTKAKGYLEQFLDKAPRHPLADHARSVLSRLEGSP